MRDGRAEAANYFFVGLGEDGEIEIDYLAASCTDGLTGVTQRGGAADPGETALSEDDDRSTESTTYELSTQPTSSASTSSVTWNSRTITTTSRPA